MDSNAIGSWASIISLPLSLYAFYQAKNIKSVLRARALDAKVKASFARLRDIKENYKITTSIRSDISSLIRDLNDFYIGRIWFQDKEPKKIIARIEKDLQVDPDAKLLKRELESLEDIIFCNNTKD